MCVQQKHSGVGSYSRSFYLQIPYLQIPYLQIPPPVQHLWLNADINPAVMCVLLLLLQDQLEMLKLVALDPSKKEYASAEALKMYMESKQ